MTATRSGSSCRLATTRMPRPQPRWLAWLCRWHPAAWPAAIGLLLRPCIDRAAGRPDGAGRAGARAARAVRRRCARARAHHARPQGRSSGAPARDPHPGVADPGSLLRPQRAIPPRDGPRVERRMAGARRRWAAPHGGGGRARRSAARLTCRSSASTSPTGTIATRRRSPTRRRFGPIPPLPMPHPARWRPTGSWSCWSTPRWRSSTSGPPIGSSAMATSMACSALVREPAPVWRGRARAARRSWRRGSMSSPACDRAGLRPAAARRCSGLPAGRRSRMRPPTACARERVSTAVARLDLAILHAALLDDLLGIDAADVAAGDRLAYTRSEAEARTRRRATARRRRRSWYDPPDSISSPPWPAPAT